MHRVKPKNLSKIILSDSLTEWYRDREEVKHKTDRDLLLSDPFYRFIRIINLLDNNIPVNELTNSHCLDLGCGPGNFASIITKIFNLNMVAVDQWDLDKQISNIPFSYIDMNIANDWPFEYKSFDLVSALEVIEHMVDTDSFLKKVYNILKPGGYFILTTPNINCLRNRLMIPLGKYPVPMEYKNVIHHVRLYNRNLLEKHLNEYNFKIIKTIGVSFLKEKHNRYKILKYISEKIADKFPQFCNNIITIAKKKRE